MKPLTNQHRTRFEVPSYGCALALLAMALFAVACGGGVEKSPAFPPTEPLAAEDQTRIHSIRDRVADLRELPVNDQVKESVVQRDAFRQYLKEGFDRPRKDETGRLEAMNIAFRMLRMIGPNEDLLGRFESTYGDEVVGLYLSTEDRLVVVADAKDGGLNEELTLAHEYVHALQDRAFNLDEFRKQGNKDTESELPRTIACVYEGDATFTSFVYMTRKYGPSWFTRISDPKAVAAQGQVQPPDAIQRYVAFNYVQCVGFAGAVWRKSGWRGIDELYQSPPTTSEQVLHAEKYFEHEEARDVQARPLEKSLGSGWKKLEASVFGEFDVFNYLAAAVNPRSAASAADGWGGGRMNLYSRKTKEQKQEVVLHIALEWDNAHELDEFRREYNDALDALHYDSRAMTEDRTVWDWQSSGEYGSAVWNDKGERVDLLFGTDKAAVANARSSLVKASGANSLP